LLYSGFEHLNLNRIFIAAILIGACGTVLDVTIDVSTAMSEVLSKRPDLQRRELIKSEFVVRRKMTNTMITTLDRFPARKRPRPQDNRYRLDSWEPGITRSTGKGEVRC
jgi:hypothetical protein